MRGFGGKTGFGRVATRLILQKYLSWLLSTSTLVVLSYQILPKGFSEIADWLGPVFGPAFRPELSLIFLILGPSMSYTPLLLTWLSGGVVGGFFARGTLRSMAVGTLSTMTLVLLIAANGFVIFTGLGSLFSGGFSGLNIPPPPPGLSLADILNAPLAAQGIGAVISGGGLNPLSIVESLAKNFIINLAVYAVSFILSGFVFSRLFHGRRSSPPPVQGYPTPQPAGQPVLGALSIALVVLMFLTSGLAGPASLVHAAQLSSGQPGEQLALNLQQDGTLTTAYSSNVSSLPGVPLDYQRPEFQGLVGGFLFAFNGSINLGQSGGSAGSLSFLIPLLPPNGFLAVYMVPDSSTGRARADVLASEFGQGFGVGLQSTVSTMLPSFGGQQAPSGGIYLAIYTGNSQAGTVGAKVLSLVQGTGVGSILTPERVFISQFGVQAGFVNFNFQNATSTPILVPSVQLTADLTPLGNFFGHGNFTLGLRRTFGTQGTIGPSAVARTTNIQLAFPTNSTVTGYWPTNATLSLSQGQLTYSMNTTSTPVSDVYVNFTSTFPQRVTVVRQIDPKPPFSSGTTVTETVTITNLGNDTIRGVVVSEKRSFQTYPTLHLLSTSQNVSLGDIPPQASASATFQFRVGSDGFYTLSPVQVSYTDQGQSVSKASSAAFLQSSFSLSLYLQELVGRTAPYSYLFLLFLVLPPLLQIPKLFRRGRRADNRYSPSPVSMGTR